MKKEKFFNFLQTIATIVLSLIILFIGTATPFYFSITALTKPKTIVKIIQNIDYKTIIKENSELKSNLLKVGIDGEAADKLMKSPEAAIIIEDYSDEITDILVNIPTDKKFDISLVQQVIDDNIDAVYNAIKQNTKTTFSKEELNTEINSAVKNYEKTLEKSLPTIKQISVLVKTVEKSKTIKNILTPKFAAIIFSLLTLLCGGICSLKYKRFAFLKWLAVDFLICCFSLGGIIIFNNTTIINRLAVKTSNFGSQVIASTISILVDKLGIAFLIFYFLTVIMLTIYAVIFFKILSVQNAPKNDLKEELTIKSQPPAKPEA